MYKLPVAVPSYTSVRGSFRRLARFTCEAGWLLSTDCATGQYCHQCPTVKRQSWWSQGLTLMEANFGNHLEGPQKHFSALPLPSYNPSAGVLVPWLRLIQRCCSPVASTPPTPSAVKWQIIHGTPPLVHLCGQIRL